MVYELSATLFTAFAYVILTWTAIMALFIVGTTFRQMKQVFGTSEADQPVLGAGDD